MRERVKNDVIKETANVQQIILERMEIRSLKWFNHLMKMEQERSSHKLFK
jgi:hypothetical protein